MTGATVAREPRALRRHVPPAQKPHRRLLAQVLIARHRLDREIAQGHALDGAALTLRAQQLCSAQERQTIAAGLARIIEAAHECADDPASHLVVDHAAVLANAPALTAIIERLTGDAKLDVRAVALAGQLVDSRVSPLVRACPEGSLQQSIDEILRLA